MIGILLIAHGGLGADLIDSAAHILGARPPRLAAIAVQPNDDPAGLAQRAKLSAAEIDDGSGVLLMTDICGATPCNVASRLVEPGRLEVVAGLSLPMLLRALTYRNEPLAKVVGKALSGGSEGVMQMPPANPHAA